MIIHSQRAETKKVKKATSEDKSDKTNNFCRTDKINLPSRFQEGLANPQAGPKDFIDNINPYGFLFGLPTMVV